MENEARLSLAEKAVREHLATQQGVATAFLAGSLVEGYGNPSSDIDVLVLLEDRYTPVKSGGQDRRHFRFEDCDIDLLYVESERLDIETRSLTSLNVTLHQLQNAPTTQQAVYDIDLFVFQFLHQMRVGRPMTRPDVLESLRSSVNWEYVSSLLSLRHEADYGGHAEDAAGAIHARDVGTAMLTSRKALGSAMDCLIAALGHTNPKEKWRYRKLADLGREDLIQQGLSLELDTDYTAEKLLGTARRRLIAAQDYIGQAGKLRLNLQ